MSRAASPPALAAALVGVLLLTACPPSRYRLADPPMRAGLNSDDRRCVLPPPGLDRQPGHLDPFFCAAWTDRDQSAVHPHQWIFFPHFSIGASMRTARDCPECVLDVQKGDKPTYQVLTLKVPPDGKVLARYTGQSVGGLFHGQGRLALFENPICAGECQDLFVATGKVATEVAVEGSWREGFLVTEPTFSGRFIHANGERYTGGLRYDPLRGLVPDGRGAYTFENGDLYDGEFVDGVREGAGSWVGADGRRYDGQWSRGRRHGQGKAIRPDGSVYVGEFERDVRSGEGRLRLVDGTEHKGTFKAGVIHGPGIQTTPVGFRVKGTWENGKLADGDGDLRWPDTSTYVGTIRDANPHGQGVATFPDGARYLGGWSKGRAAGRGAYVFPDGAVLLGELVDGKIEGCALVRGPTGADAEPDRWVGTFVRSEPVEAGCTRAPPTWSTNDVGPLEELDIGRRELVDAWLAQRRTLAARRTAQERLPEILARFADPRPDVTDAEAAQIRLGLAWPSAHQQRFVHGSCVLGGTVRTTVDGERERARRAGLLDARVLLELPTGRTTEVCVEIEGPCGRWRGCAAADTGSSSEPPGLIRVLLEQLPPPPDEPMERSSPAPTDEPTGESSEEPVEP